MTRRRPALSPAEDLAEAQRELDAAAAATAAASDAWMYRWDLTEAQERRGQAAWDKAHEAQNAAARRLHAAEERARWSRGPDGRWIRA
jgi:hypothetical protein